MGFRLQQSTEKKNIYQNKPSKIRKSNNYVISAQKAFPLKMEHAHFNFLVHAIV
jgi:hypothetical protein